MTYVWPTEIPNVYEELFQILHEMFSATVD